MKTDAEVKSLVETAMNNTVRNPAVMNIIKMKLEELGSKHLSDKDICNVAEALYWMGNKIK